MKASYSKESIENQWQHLEDKGVGVVWVCGGMGSVRVCQGVWGVCQGGAGETHEHEPESNSTDMCQVLSQMPFS